MLSECSSTLPRIYGLLSSMMSLLPSSSPLIPDCLIIYKEFRSLQFLLYLNIYFHRYMNFYLLRKNLKRGTEFEVVFSTKLNKKRGPFTYPSYIWFWFSRLLSVLNCRYSNPLMKTNQTCKLSFFIWFFFVIELQKKTSCHLYIFHLSIWLLWNAQCPWL